MAQKTDIRLRRSDTAGKIPTSSNLSDGELAINTNSGALYFKKSDDTIITAHDNTILHIDSDTTGSNETGTSPKVGINKTNPIDALDVNGKIRTNDRVLSNTYQSTSTYGLQFANSAGAIQVFKSDGGNLGIGTTSPVKGLHLQSDSSEAKRSIRLMYDADYYWDVKQKGAGGIQYNAHNATSGGHRFDIDGTEKFRIAYNGKVGIGITAPDELLHVKGTNGAIAIDGNGANNTASIKFINDNERSRISSNYDTGGGGRLTFHTDTTGGSLLERMRITNAGNVGIGTSNPSQPLHVEGNVRIADAGSIQFGSSFYQTITGQSGSNDLLYRTFQDHVFKTGTGPSSNTDGTTRMVIDVNGKVGIGTASPEQILHIKDTTNPGSTTGSVIIEGQRDGTANLLELRARDNSSSGSALPNGQGSIIRFTGFDGTDFEEMAFIGAQADGAAIANADAPSRLIFGTTVDGGGEATEKMRIDSSGAITFNTAYTFPTADGSAGQVLKTDGSGNLSFAADSGGSGATDEIADADGDTKIQVEESSDEDKIRFDAGGVERFRVGSDVEVIAATDFNITGSSRNLSFTSGTGTIRTTTGNSLILATNSTTAVTVDSSQNSTFAGNVVLSSNSKYVATRQILARDVNGLSIGTTNATTAISIDNSANVTMPQNLTVTGDLTVNGASTTLNVATLDVEDKNITLNKGSGDTSSSADGAGITIQDAVNASTDATLLWNSSGDHFAFSHRTFSPQFVVTDTNAVIYRNSNNLEFITYGGFDINLMPAGDVGIGTRTPDAKLRIDQDAAAVGLKVTGGASGQDIAQFVRDISADTQVNISGESGRPQIRFIQTGGNTFAIGSRSNSFEIADNSHLGSNTRLTIDNTGRVGIGVDTATQLAKLQVEVYGIDTTTTSTSATTQVAIHTFPIANFRSARFTIQVTNSTDDTYHTTELLALHDGTTANITEFGTIFTGAAIEAQFDSDINSGNFRLLATPASTDSMVFKVVSHSITV